MCMDEFVKRLYDFMGIYRIFWSQNSHYRYLLIFTDILPIFTDIYLYFTDILSIYTDILPIFFQKFQHKHACSTVAIFWWKNRFFSNFSAKNRRFYRFFPHFFSDRFFLNFFFSVPAENRFFDDISTEKIDFLFPDCTPFGPGWRKVKGPLHFQGLLVLFSPSGY